MQAQLQVQGAILLAVVTRQQPAILEFLPCETQTLLVWWDAVFVLDPCFHVADGVGRLHVGHATPVNVLTKICVQPREPFLRLARDGSQPHGVRVQQPWSGRPPGSSQRGQNESTPEQDAYDDAAAAAADDDDGDYDCDFGDGDGDAGAGAGAGADGDGDRDDDGDGDAGAGADGDGAGDGAGAGADEGEGDGD